MNTISNKNFMSKVKILSFYFLGLLCLFFAGLLSNVSSNRIIYISILTFFGIMFLNLYLLEYFNREHIKDYHKGEFK
jgi:hypothetical protein